MKIVLENLGPLTIQFTKRQAYCGVTKIIHSRIIFSGAFLLMLPFCSPLESLRAMALLDWMHGAIGEAMGRHQTVQQTLGKSCKMYMTVTPEFADSGSIILF